MTHLTLARLLSAAALAGAAPAAAQQGTPAPSPAPRPAPAPGPTIITIPGAEKFDLRGPRTTPQQTPAPTPAPAAVQPPPIRTAPSPAATRPRITPSPAPSRPAPVQAEPSPTPSPTASATPAPPVAAPSPVASAVPAPVPVPTPAAQPAPVPVATALPAWWPWAAGAGALALGWLGWLLVRARKRRAKEARRAERRAAAQAAPPPAPVVPRAAPPPPAPPPPPPPPPPSGDPIGFEFRPTAIDVTQQGVILQYELLVGNLSEKQIEGIRVSLAMISANPLQDSWIESFHSVPAGAPIAQDVELQPKSGGKIEGRTMLTHERIHVVDVGGRKMFVPIVMIDARWRGGLSIRQTGADFMIGTAGQGAKLGPIWLDRGAARIEALAANRYFRKSVVQAAE